MKIFLGILIFLVAAAAALFAFSPEARERVSGYFSNAPQQEQNEESGTASTPQAPFTEATLRMHLGDSKSAGDITIAPLNVVEDSRCPADVQCIWAGRVMVRVQITSPSGTSVETFTEGMPITTETRKVVLAQVLPRKQTTGAIPVAEYEFVFEVQKRTDL